MKKDEPPQTIGKVIDSLLKSWNLDRKGKEQAVFQMFDKAVGKELAGKMKPVFVHQGFLVVAVRDSAWLQEMHFLKDELKKKLNRELGGGVIREIRFKVGSWIEEPGEGLYPRVELSEDDIIKAKEAAAGVHDPRLRDQIYKALLVMAERQKHEEEDE